MPRSNSEKDIWNNCDRSGGKNSCWLWLKSKSPKGYGKTHWRGKEYRAHRLAYFLTYGKQPYCVLHTCDTPSCINPKHLFAGDHKTNAIDRSKKGRGYQPKGEIHHMAKLNAVDVINIRKLYQHGVDKKSLSKKFKITADYIGQLINRQRWAHL